MVTFIAVQRARLLRGTPIFQHLALCVERELGTVTPILESDCTFLFTVFMLLVEGLEVFAALSFDTVVMLVLVVVGTKCRAEESSGRDGTLTGWW